jgi:hypothetical protein
VLIAFPADQFGYSFPQEIRQHHPNEECKTEIKAYAHQRQQTIWVDKKFVNENCDKENERNEQRDSDKMAQQEQQGP